MWPTSTFKIHLLLYFLRWPHIALYFCADWGQQSMFLLASLDPAGVVPTISLQQTAQGHIMASYSPSFAYFCNQLIAFRPKASWSGDRGLQIGLIC